ncbi:MAG: hypothetical protein IMX00_04415 [Limnochordales bacterium]|nr:hypothetical protein [Limnochordales bacterium]
MSVTEELIQNRLRAVLQPKFDRAEFRLSEVGKCPRMRVMRVLGYEEQPPTEEDARYFERGHIAEAWVVQQYRRTYPRHTRAQMKVHTPYGTGHIDLWFPGKALIVEVKSVGRWSFDNAIPRDEHIAQVQAYLHFFRDHKGQRRADHAELVYVDMDTLRMRVFPVQYDPTQGEAIEKELEQLTRMANLGQLPPVTYFPDQEPCVTHTPQGVKRCPFWQHCHSETDPFDPLYSGKPDEEALQLIAQYREVKSKLDELEKSHKQATEPLRAKVTELQEALDAVYDRLGVDETIAPDGTTVKRTKVPGRLTWDLDSAEKAGVFTSEMKQALLPFAKQTGGYTRWTLKGGKR